jgi:HAD superfamily hydrolase (TIGR01549 family)
MTDALIFDLDGTLIDSNYQQAIAWYRAFRRHDLTVAIWQIHRALGMGGDQLVAAVTDDHVERTLGDQLRTAWGEEFEPMLAEIRPFEGVTALLADLHERDVGVVFASSGKPEHVDHYLELIDGKRYAQGWTTSQDVEKTKPAPDLVRVAMSQVHGTDPLMVGDSTWDAIAARRAGVGTYALRSGGFGVDELRAAGALGIFDSIAELHSQLATVLGT